MSSPESKIIETGAVRGPSTRRIKLVEEALTEAAIQRLSQQDEGSRDWARGANKRFVPAAE